MAAQRAAIIQFILLSCPKVFWNYGRATLGIEFLCDKRGKGFCGPAMTWHRAGHPTWMNLTGAGA